MKTNVLYNRALLLVPLLLLFIAACTDKAKDDEISDYRQAMRDFVIGISQYAKAQHPDFVVIPQNGIELISQNPDYPESLNTQYLDAIDGLGQEDLNYGYNEDDEPTPVVEITYMNTFLQLAKNAGKTILVTDYCSSLSYMDHSFNANYNSGYISFAADHRGLDNIPAYPADVYRENSFVVDTLSKAKNFLYLIDPSAYSSKHEFISAVRSKNYDLLIMDLFLNDSTSFTVAEIDSLRLKNNFGKRMVICYMSIGEAENYRYYWKSSWSSKKPDWLREENPDWEGNYKVEYWNSSWQKIIYGNSDSYLDKILNAGFDGVYLDIIDAFEYFE
jgi:cysteinyl-tRNA synthetase